MMIELVGYLSIEERRGKENRTIELGWKVEHYVCLKQQRKTKTTIVAVKRIREGVKRVIYADF